MLQHCWSKMVLPSLSHTVLEGSDLFFCKLDELDAGFVEMSHNQGPSFPDDFILMLQPSHVMVMSEGKQKMR